MGLERDALRPCASCSRHIYGEQRCPFCGTRISVVSLLPFAVSLLIAGACSERAFGPDEATGSAATSTTGDDTTGAETASVDPETSTTMTMTATTALE